MRFWDALHFIRPDWLWALLLLPAALLVGWYRRHRSAQWHDAVDAHLLPHLLTGTTRRSWWGAAALLIGLLLAVLALAGPSWRQVEQPLWQSKTPLVVVLDLSSSMTTPDLPPSRLLQARAKLATLLRERKGGEVALVAYAWEPFTVAPLTDDAANVALFLDALSPSVMPVDGQKPDKALAWAGALLEQSGARQGDVLLLTDHADPAAQAAATRLHAAGYRVSVLGLGSLQGAAYRDGRGSIEHAHLDESSLRALAAAGGGGYQRIATDGTDLQALDLLQPQARATAQGQAQKGKSWQDEGYWLLLPLLLLALFAFRRPKQGLAALALCLLLPVAIPQQAQAAEKGGWWQRADQVQHQQLEQGVDAYRKGDFATAQKQFQGIDTDEGQYNLGNALARQGKYDDAIAAYDRALELHPGMQDAIANRAAVDAARKRKSQQDQQGQQNKQQGQQDKNDSGQPQDQQGKQGQPKDGSQQGQSQQNPAQQQQDKQGQDGKDGKPDPASPASQQDRPPSAEDAAAQQKANQAQRERMAEAMRQAQEQAGDEKAKAEAARLAAMTPEQREQQRAVEAWMQRVPDEPGDLLKAKFKLEYERRMREQR